MDKKYIKSVLIYILSGILSIMGIGYIAYHMSGGSVTNVHTEIAMPTEMEYGITVDALLMRDEIPIEGQGSDICGILRDGENAQAGQEVLWIFSGEGNVGDQIRGIEAQIRVLQDSLLGDTIPSGLNTNQKELDELYNELLDTLGNGSLAGLDKTTIGLQTCINRKKNSEKTKAAIRTSIKELTEQRKALLNAHSAGVKTLSTPEAGLFYSFTDGFETLCDAKTANNITYSDYLALYERIDRGETANGGVCKVATDTYWYVCLTLDSTLARDLSEGDSYTLTFAENNDTKVEMTLVRMVSEYGEKESLLVFGGRSVPENFHFKRTQKVTLVTKIYKGFHVPAQAVRYVDGKVGVYVTDGNKVRLRQIEILYVKDGNCIVKQYDTTKEGYGDMLRLYDKIILSGKGLYDGKYLD